MDEVHRAARAAAGRRGQGEGDFYAQNDEFCTKQWWTLYKMYKRMMDSVLKMMDSVQNMMDSVLKLMHLSSKAIKERQEADAAKAEWMLKVCISNDEFV